MFGFEKRAMQTYKMYNTYIQYIQPCLKYYLLVVNKDLKYYKILRPTNKLRKQYIESRINIEAQEEEEEEAVLNDWRLVFFSALGQHLLQNVSIFTLVT
jgi:hypothetical protein